MCKKYISLFLFALAFTFFVPTSYAYTPDELVQSQTVGQNVKMTLEAPYKVHDGRAFVIKVALQNSVPTVLVDWLGKTYTVPTSVASDGNACAVSCLLPVPLDTASGTHTLTVEASSDLILKQRIAIEALQYPEQALTVEPKYVQPPESVLSQIRRDRAKVKPLLKLKTPMQDLFGGQKNVVLPLPLFRPVKGIVTSPYGVHRVFNNQPKGSHMGLDLRGATGTPIHACADGRVVLAEELYYAGNAVYVDHGLGVITAYMHMSAFSVKEGDMVKAGDELGKVGMTGRVTGPHLHLSVYVFGTSVDPLPLLSE